MKPLLMIETAPEAYSLLLHAGTTDVDEVIEELGHEPNGYFWEGIAQLLVDAEAPHLAGRFDYDPEGDTFVAHGSDRLALDELATLMTAAATEPRGSGSSSPSRQIAGSNATTDSYTPPDWKPPDSRHVRAHDHAGQGVLLTPVYCGGSPFQQW